ncbi:MAG TPA: hypothetical protein PKW95_14865 [bacterium]|nr:hypothetical protein [bacterium]
MFIIDIFDNDINTIIIIFGEVMQFGIIAWATGKVFGVAVNKLVHRLSPDLKNIQKSFKAAIKDWEATIPPELQFHADSLFPSVSDDSLSTRPYLQKLRNSINNNNIPSIDDWNNALKEQWRMLNESSSNLVSFFHLKEDDAYNYLSDLSQRLHCTYFKNNLPIAQLEMFNDLETIKSFYKDNSDATGQSTQAELTLMNHELPTYAIKYENFIDLLLTITQNNVNEIKKYNINEIFRSIWRMLLNHSQKIITFIEQLNYEKDSPMALLVVPIINIYKNHNLSKEVVRHFFYLQESHPDFFIEESQKSHNILKSVVIRHLLYINSPALNDILHTCISSLLAYKDAFWDTYFCDLFMRFKSGYINISDDLTIHRLKKRLEDEQCNTSFVLQTLYKITTDKMTFYYNNTKEQFVETIMNISSKCTTDLESKWCILICLQMLPLYRFEEENEDDDLTILSIIQSFNSYILSASPVIQFQYLSALLRNFNRDKNINDMIKYEKEFLHYKKCLYSPQIILLQMEYATYVAIHAPLTEPSYMEETKIFKTIQANQNPLEDELFKNELTTVAYNIIMGQVKVEPTFSKPYTIDRFLTFYVKYMYQFFFMSELKKNHIRVLDIQPMTAIFPVRESIFNVATGSFIERSQNIEEINPIYAARTLSTYRYIRKIDTFDALENYLQKAMLADPYSIVRNARGIAEAMYKLYYYYPPAKKKCLELLSKFQKITKIGSSLTPKLFWAIATCIDISEKDRDFINQFCFLLDMIDLKFLRIVLKKGEHFGFEFNDLQLSNIQHYSSKGSVLARAVLQDITSPEIWNLIGTTLINLINDVNDAQSYLHASYFYSMAKCFAKDKGCHDQKYSYNFIRAHANYYQKMDLVPDGRFIRQVTYFLAGRDISHFHYKEECIMPFLDICNRYWDQIRLDNDTKDKLKAHVKDKSWIQQLVIKKSYKNLT